MLKISQILEEAKAMSVDALSLEVWLAYLMGKERVWLFMHDDAEVPVEVEGRFWQGAEQMQAGKPVAQLTGGKEFYGLEFFVNEHVLVPRPESELIVDLAKDFVRENFPDGMVTVVDVGTGSGCILLSILSVLPEACGIGLEVSEKALVVARENAVRLGMSGRVEFLPSNLLEQLKEPAQIIVANLPYIGREKFHFVADNVAKFEPEVALFGGSDGLELYRQMFEQLMSKSWRPAFLAGEFGFGQEEVMREVLQKYFGGQKFEIIPDLAGIPRVFVVNFARS